MPNRRKRSPFNTYWIYGLIILGIFAIQYFSTGHSPAKTTIVGIEKMAKNGDIEKILVEKGRIEKAYITLKPTSVEGYKKEFDLQNSNPADKGPHFEYQIGSVQTFSDQIVKINEALPEGTAEISLEYDTVTDYYGNIFYYVLMIGLPLLLFLYIMRSMSRGGAGGGGGGIFSVGKSQAKIFDPESKVKMSFKDVAGLAEAKEEVEEIVEFLKTPDKYTKIGGKIPKGALLVGPPGTGKTLLAKAMAGEANVPFFSMSGSDFVEMFVGVGASRVRDLFRQAKEKAPCIVFIDEIDAVGRARGSRPSMGGNDERENTLNQLLTEMDGFETNSGIIVLAATNRVDVLDNALLRAGRFDRQIHVDLPDLNEREEIFKVHLRDIKCAADLDVSFLAKQTPGFSGADIANACNESALIAARRGKNEVERQDFMDAVDRIVGGLEKRNRIITADEKRRIALHEAGHASCSWLLEHAHPLVKVTIVPRGKSLGAAWYLPEERSLQTRNQLLDQMCSLLGGRAAEELFTDDISSGAQNDLERTTKMASMMVSVFGMSNKVGNVSYYDSTNSDMSFTKPYSERTAEVIDDEINILINEQYSRAKKLLSENKEKHNQLADLLLEREVIMAEDLEKIFGKRPWGMPDDKDSKASEDTKVEV
ncbi:MAG: ATP-dependent zinc metalloprotease FtsH [Bacteroidales bacterium]